MIQTLQLIIAISLLVLIHELGHFFFARLFGIRVDKFYLFFDFGDTKPAGSAGSSLRQRNGRQSTA